MGMRYYNENDPYANSEYPHSWGDEDPDPEWDEGEYDKPVEKESENSDLRTSEDAAID
jgi:hypothetical protein